MIRSRDSEKTIGVEVLTLPYGENCYELATNIHQVDMVTSPAQLMSIIEEEISDRGDVLVMGYPIGVTEQILSQLQSQAKNPKEFIFPPLTWTKQFIRGLKIKNVLIVPPIKSSLEKRGAFEQKLCQAHALESHQRVPDRGQSRRIREKQ